MAIFGPFTDGRIEVDSNNLSAYCRQFSLKASKALLDASVMGQTSKGQLVGLADWSITAEFLEDTVNVDKVLFDLWDAGLPFDIKIRPKSDAVSGSNPEYSGNVVLADCPFGGAHGALLTKSVTFNSAGDLTRSES